MIFFIKSTAYQVFLKLVDSFFPASVGLSLRLLFISLCWPGAGPFTQLSASFPSDTVVSSGPSSFLFRARLESLPRASSDFLAGGLALSCPLLLVSLPPWVWWHRVPSKLCTKQSITALYSLFIRLYWSRSSSHPRNFNWSPHCSRLLPVLVHHTRRVIILSYYFHRRFTRNTDHWSLNLNVWVTKLTKSIQVCSQIAKIQISSLKNVDYLKKSLE